MRKPRNLSPEERNLWDHVARTTDPLKPAKRALEKPATPKQPDRPKESPPEPVPSFRVGQAVNHRGNHDILPSLNERLAKGAIDMDKKAYGKLRRGKMRPEARIDLHGMTLAAAHPALLGFVLSNHAAGKRLLLVITGKGRLRDDDGPIPSRPGVLRHQVPQWLKMPPLQQIVLQVSQAHISHGGHGAYYVYLRRDR